MIVLKLMGGMGNQMFQYAMARTLSNKHDCELLVDTSLCEASENLNSAGLSLRPFELDVFGIQGQVIDDEYPGRIIKVRKECGFKRRTALMFCRIANMFSNSWKIRIYERKSIVFDKSLLKLPSDVLLKGYFPSYKYFEEAQELVRQDYIFKVKPDSQNQKAIEMISSCNAVSLHIRRGDYISNENTKDKFGICSMAYYQKAIDHITKSVKDPRFFVFTNDPDFVNKNLELDYPTEYIKHNSGDKSYEDMRLMSLCKHNIIANSSFSWWGAWLNDNPGKIVIGPSPVFDKIEMSDDDFYPEQWIKIPKN